MENLGPFRKSIITNHGKLANRLQLLLAGLVWLKVEYVSSGEGDYSKWLGPEWKPQWEGAGTLICNHVSWMDIASCLAIHFPSFVAKSSVKSYPFIGKIAIAIDCFFTERAGTKEEKIKVLKAIEQRQAKNEEKGGRPILIFPEGATTNNEQIIGFKRGPFSGLNSVQPLGMKFWSPTGISVQNDTIFQWHYFICFMSPFHTGHMKVYPVFKPNQFFWDNHWSESSGEQKWEAYARVVREHIIAKSFNFKLSDNVMEDKFEFKDLLKGKKSKKA